MLIQKCKNIVGLYSANNELIQLFNSNVEVAKYLNCHKGTVGRYIKSKKRWANQYYIKIVSSSASERFMRMEAELVAGYNVEYSSLGFALFFIAEYANMAVMSAVACIYFLGGFSALKLTALFFAFVWTRGTLPRYRYDQFMRLGWKAFLPLCLAFFGLYAALAL